MKVITVSRRIVLCLGLLLAGEPALAATLGDAVAAFRRGDFDAAVSIVTPLANAGDPRAQNVLGTMFELGQGTRKDYAVAAKWYALAAKSGDADAEGNLGRLYGQGLGVRRDLAEAVRWLSLSENHGSAEAPISLGKIFSDGAHAYERGDYSAALEMWGPLAKAGHSGSAFMIGRMYDDGRGVKPDRGLAGQFYEQAADEGNTTAQFNIAAMYMEMLGGVPFDYVEAFKWMTIASDGATDTSVTPKAKEALNYLSAHMTQAQITRAKGLVQTWRPKPTLKIVLCKGTNCQTYH